MTKINGKYLTKVYKNGAYGLKNCSISINGGEFLVIVGASGSGKSTLLRVLAGTEPLSSGELYFDGILSDNIKVQKRNTAMVFQEYLLYPHMTVFDNLATPLKLKGEDEKKIYDRVMDTLRLFDLDRTADVKPKHLSGGEQQRVALAKAIIRRSNLVLLDEPLSNVDEKSRWEYCNALKKTKRLLPDSTFVYVTHNPKEAFFLADRIAVMQDGGVIQIGTKDFVRDHPSCPDVSALLSLDSAENTAVSSEKLCFGGRLDGDTLSFAGQSIKLSADYVSRLLYKTEVPRVMLDAEKFRKTPSSDSFSLVLSVIENGGEYILLESEGERLLMNRRTDLKPGEKIRLYYRPDDITLYDGEDRLTCHYPLKRKTEIKRINDNTAVILGKRVKLKHSIPDGARYALITDESFKISTARDKHSVKVLGCLDEELINRQKLLYLDIKGAVGYLSFICDEHVCPFGKEKLWLNIYPEKIEFT